MRRKKRSVLCGLLTVAAVAGISMLTPCTVSARPFGSERQIYQEVETKSVELEGVDKSKGVTYVYSETGSLLGINLNGNSVIIQDAEKPGDETSTKYCKIYIDANGNGSVDAGETAQQLPALDETEELSEYIQVGPPIYGVYKEKATEPISITCQFNGQAVYGVYEGESADITVNNTGNLNVLYAAYNSVVTGDVTMNNTGVTASALFGASGCTVTGDITMTNHNISVGTVMASYSGTVKGNVTMNMTASEEFTGSCGTVFGANATNVTGKVNYYHDGGTISNNEYAVFEGFVHSEDTTAPAVLVDVKNGMSCGNVGAVKGAEVTSKAPTAVKYTAKDHNLNGYVYIVNNSAVTAAGEQPVALDLDVTGTTQLPSNFFCLCVNESSATVVGDVDVNIQLDALPASSSGMIQMVYGNLELQGNVKAVLKNVYVSSLYGIGGYTSSGDCVVAGDVTIDMTGCQVSGSAYMVNNSYVKGALSVTGDSTTCLYSCYYTYYSTVEKDVKVSLYGYDADTSKTYSSGVYGINYKYKDKEYSVGQNVDTKLLGGTFSYLYIANYDSVIVGNVTFQMKGITYTDASYILYDAKVGGDVTITSDESCMFKGSINCVSGSEVDGNVDIDITDAYEPENTSSYSRFYGINGSNVGGTVDISVKNGIWYEVYGVCNSTGTYGKKITGTCNVSLQNMTVTSYIYGICSGTYDNAVNVTIKNMKSNTYAGYSTYLYGATDAVMNGTLDLTVTDNEGMYTVYTLSGGRIEKDATVTISNMDVKQNFHAKDYSDLSCGGNVTISVDKVSAPCWYGIAGNVFSEEKLTITATDCSSSEYTYLSNNSNINAKNGIRMDFNNCTFKTAYAICFVANADNKVNFTGGSIEINGQISGINGSAPATVAINYKDVDIKKPSSYTGTWSMNNNCAGTMVLDVLFDDACTFSDEYTVYANNNSSACPTMVHMGNDYYFAGTYPVTAQLVSGADMVGFNNYHLEIPTITAKQVKFDSCQVAIPETTTVTAENNFVFNNSSIVLEGTLTGACEQDALTSASFYMNGGTITDTDFDAAATKFHKVTLDYDADAMTVTHPFVSSPMREELMFAKATDSPSIVATVKTGYQLGEATVLVEGEENGTTMSATTSGTKTTYKYDMGSKPVAIKINSEGIPIVVGKTVADPIAELNREYTEDEPLYDFGSLLIYNDAVEGDNVVTYSLAEDEVLPEGISLVEGKLIGTATDENKSGTPVKFVVTGKNQSTKEVTLNIIVSSDPDTIQDNQDGRIVVDDTAKTINCMASSVILKACEEGTEIYLDDNRDGVADHSEPAVKGDYSTYTLYGLKSYETTKPLQIVMEGGTIANLYAVYGGKVKTSDCGASVNIRLQGGKISGYAYGASSNSIVTEGVCINCTGTTITATYIRSKDGTSACKYGYVNNNGKLTMAGTYTFTEDLEATQLIISAGTSSQYNTIEIADGVKVSVTTMSVGSYTLLYNKGTLECTGTYSTGGSTVRHLVIGDAKVLPEDNTFAYLYYPMSLTYDALPAGAKAPTLKTSNNYCKYEGVMYASDSINTTSVQYYLIQGYTAYYSVNGGEEIKLGTLTGNDIYLTSVSPTCERKPMQVKLFYIPNELEASVKFSGPTAEVGKEYTAEEPLYDYTTITLKNDAGKTIGTDVTYKVLPGSELPAGLSLEDGKVLGTPTGENGSTVSTTVLITGRNGASVEVTLEYTIVSEAVEDKSINDMITFNGSVLDLQGTSVVMYPDAENTSYANIYLDENHDGIADNNKPFVYKGSTAINLSSATVYGYSDTTTSYEGDISIYVNGGTINNMYGAYGTGASANTVVDGTVSLYMNGATVNGVLAAGYYATAKELNLYCKAGQMTGNLFAAYYPGSVDNVHFSFIEDAYYTYGSSSNYMAVTVGGNVSGNVEAVVGGTNNSFSTYSGSRNYCKFNGVYKTTVGGDVNYVIQGNWYTYQYNNHFASEATISGDMNIDWRKGCVNVTSGSDLTRTFANNCTIQNLNIQVAENATMSRSSEMYPYYSGTIQNVYMDVPTSITGTIFSDLKHPYSSSVTYPVKNGYLYNKGTLYIMGDYTLNQDITTTLVSVYEGATLTIAQGATLTSSGTVSGYGNIINNGVLQVNSYLTMYEGTKLSNKGTMNVSANLTLNIGSAEDSVASQLVNEGTMKTSGYVNNHGTITNAGSWVSGDKINLYSASTITNTGEWNSVGQVVAMNTNTSILNEGVWTAEALINAQNAGTKLTNTGEWTSNYRIYLSGTDTVITNRNIWNMNCGIHMQSNSQVVNEGSFIGKYKSMNTYECIYATGASKITNSGTWEGNSYICLSNATFDNAGTMEINPATETSTAYNFYLSSSSTLINRESATCNLKAYLYNNSGKLVNFGTFKQTYADSYYYRLGNVYAAKPLSLAKELSEYTKYSGYVKFYYPVTVDYPETAVTGESLATVYSSGVEDDENRYLLAGSTFTVTLSGYETGFSAADVKSVTYGPEETVATLTETENQWQGTMPYEAMTVYVNVEKNGATQIEISPTSYEVTQLQVNQYNSKIYDLNNLEITGDDESEGSVSYAVSTSKPLPEGLVLSNGVISGTPKKACSEPYIAEIIVTGKNLTKATFAITFNQIEKAVPSLSIPTGMYGYTDYTLAQVRGYSNPTSGTFSWPDSSEVITEKCIAGEKFDLYFTPKDTENYDWSKISASTGTWNEEEGRLECKVGIRMYTITPTYTVPTGLTAVYGQTLADIELPSDENGAFVWRVPSASVGNVGTRSYYANYVPKDTDRYSTMTYISITIQINAKEMEVPIPTGLKTFKSNTIGQVVLPEVSYGTYKWVTASSTVVEAEKTYKLAFIPDDTTNYHWVAGEGVTYSNAYSGYVFEVPVEVIWHEEGVHTYEVKHNDTYHWKECICGDIIDKEAHKLGTPQDNGETHTETCTVDGCGYVLESEHTYTKNQNETYHWSECTCGDVIGKYEHSYTKYVYNETEHWKECSCGAKTTATAHDFKLEKADSTSHWKQCSCGAKSDVEVHSYTQTANDAENHWKECSCGAKSEIEEHSYVTNYDDTNHWKECSCGKKSDESEHTYGEWQPDEENGGHFCTCSCGSKKIAEHSEKYIWTSQDEENHIGVCADCAGGSVIEKHTWDAGKVTKSPTTTSEGERTYTCTKCKTTKTEPIAKLPEDHEHEFGAWETDETEHWKTCTCGDEQDRGSHIWDEGTVTTEPTETAEGVKTYTCTVCGYKKTESIDRVPHEHSYGNWIPKDASTHKKVCGCGDEITGTHSFNAGVVTVEPTETAEGVKTYTCTVCGGTKTEAIDKLLPDSGDDDPDDVDSDDVGPDDDDSEDDDLPEAAPEGTKLTVPGSNVKYVVVNPKKYDFEDDTACVVYSKGTKSTATTVTIPDTITVNNVKYKVVSIAAKAFENNKKLTKVIIGENIKLIDDSAFSGCTALNTVTFKKNAKVKTIGKKAFYKCTSLKKISIPKTVETIKDNAFYGCKKLATVTFQSGSKLKTMGQKVFSGCVALKKITLPKNVTTIGASTFYGCKNLATITIQSSNLKKVGSNVFKGIKSTAKIKVPSKKLTAYMKLLKNKGQGKKVKITK